MGAPMNTLLGHPCEGRCVPDGFPRHQLCVSPTQPLSAAHQMRDHPVLGVGYVVARNMKDSNLSKLEI